MNDKERFSFSKLSCFHECKMQYYLQYIKKVEQKDNIYSNLGTCIHDILEKRQNEMDFNANEDINKFIDEVEMNEIFGIDFPSEKIKEDYIKCITHCLKTLQPFEGEIEIEKKVEFEIDGIPIVGYVDCIEHLPDGTCNIYDYKTSSMYSKKQLETKAFQLILYGLGLESLGYKINEISWIMLKYCTIKGARKEKNIKRSELEDNQEYRPCIFKYPYNKQEKERCIKWVKETVNEIDNCKEFNQWESKEITKFTTFGCQQICSVCHHCQAFKEYKKNNFNR